MIFFKYLMLAIISVLLTIGVARLGGAPFDHNYKYIVNFFFPFLIIFCSKYYNNKTIYYIIGLLPTFLISFYLFNNINKWQFFYMSTPSTLSFFIGLFVAILFFKSKNQISKIAIVIIAVILNVFVFFQGYEYWMHKINYDTFFGEQNISLTGEKYINNVTLYSKFKSKDSSVLSFVNEDLVKLYLNDKNTLYLLDFWNNNCALCIKEFPTYQKLYNKKLSDSSKLKMFLVNVLDSKSEISVAKDILVKSNITIPLLFFNGTDAERESKYHVFSYPTTLMIRNNKIIHIGNILSAQKRLDELLSE